MTNMTVVKDTDTMEKDTDTILKVAVYGSLREGLHNHGVIKGSTLLGTFESEPNYTMYSVGGSFPGLVLGGTTSVVMEVYEVTPRVLQGVDGLEGYMGDEFPDTNFYNRILMDTPYGKAYSYIYNDDVESLHIVESGDWVKFKKMSKVVNGAKC